MTRRRKPEPKTFGVVPVKAGPNVEFKILRERLGRRDLVLRSTVSARAISLNAVEYVNASATLSYKWTPVLDDADTGQEHTARIHALHDARKSNAATEREPREDFIRDHIKTCPRCRSAPEPIRKCIAGAMVGELRIKMGAALKTVTNFFNPEPARPKR